MVNGEVGEEEFPLGGLAGDGHGVSFGTRSGIDGCSGDQ